MRVRVNKKRLITAALALILLAAAVYFVVRLVSGLFSAPPTATVTPKPTVSGYVIPDRTNSGGVVVTPIRTPVSTPVSTPVLTPVSTPDSTPGQTPTPTPAPTPTATAKPGRLQLTAPVILQDPELPTGCEATSAAMLLQKYGFTATKNEIADRLPKKNMDQDGYGFDPNKYFIGNPYGSGRGCFADVLMRTINSYLTAQGSMILAYNATGVPFSYLDVLLEQGRPVVVWATMGMSNITETVSWIDQETGKEIEWKRPEHCLLLIGYDKAAGTYIFNDPQKGLTEYSAAQFKKIWEAMGSRALYLK